MKDQLKTLQQQNNELCQLLQAHEIKIPDNLNLLSQPFQPHTNNDEKQTSESIVIHSGASASVSVPTENTNVTWSLASRVSVTTAPHSSVLTGEQDDSKETIGSALQQTDNQNVTITTSNNESPIVMPTSTAQNQTQEENTSFIGPASVMDQQQGVSLEGSRPVNMITCLPVVGDSISGNSQAVVAGAPGSLNQTQSMFSLHTVSSIMQSPNLGMQVSLVPNTSVSNNSVVPVNLTLPAIQTTVSPVLPQGLINVAAPGSTAVIPSAKVNQTSLVKSVATPTSSGSNQFVSATVINAGLVSRVPGNNVVPLSSIPARTQGAATTNVPCGGVLPSGIVSGPLQNPGPTVMTKLVQDRNYVLTSRPQQTTMTINTNQLSGLLGNPVGPLSGNPGITTLGPTQGHRIVAVNIPQLQGTNNSGKSTSVAPTIVALTNPGIQTGSTGNKSFAVNVQTQGTMNTNSLPVINKSFAVNVPGQTQANINSLTALNMGFAVNVPVQTPGVVNTNPLTGINKSFAVNIPVQTQGSIATNLLTGINRSFAVKIPVQAPLLLTSPTTVQGLVTVNIPTNHNVGTVQQKTTPSVIPINTQTSGNQISILPGNYSSTTATVGLTPSPHTAFVIVRSTQPSQIQPQSSPSSSASASSQASQPILVQGNTGTRLTTSVQQNASYISQNVVFPLQKGVNGIPNVLGNTFTTAQPTALTRVSLTPIVNVAGGNVSTRKPRTKPGKRSQASDSGTLEPLAKITKASSTKRNTGKRKPDTKKNNRSKPREKAATPVATMAQPTCAPNDGVSTRPRHAQLSSNNNSSQQDDVLSNFNISNLIPCITSQSSAPTQKQVATHLNSVATHPASKSSTASNRSLGPVTTTRLSHSIESLTGKQGLQQAQIREAMNHQQSNASNVLSFSAESLFTTGDDFLHNIPPISTSLSNQSLNNSFSIPSFQDTVDTSSHQGTSNFSAEALIGSDLMLSSESSANQSSCSQSNQSSKPARTQMFSDFSAESLINSTDLGSGLSYAIDNLMARSDSGYNTSAMVTVNPNLIHNVPTNNSQEGVGALRGLQGATADTSDQRNPANMECSSSYLGMTTQSSYTAFSFNQKQQKEPYAYKPNGSVVYSGRSSSSSTSPTYLKHSVDSITSSFYGAMSSAPAGLVGTPHNNAAPVAPYTGLYSDQLNGQQPNGNNIFIANGHNRSFHGSTMGSYA
ncbi:mucin-5AC isoform X2 [Nematostella vectensis]|nr:mucin-5AC isoform X2 [Nematostella vectensis]